MILVWSQDCQDFFEQFGVDKFSNNADYFLGEIELTSVIKKLIIAIDHTGACCQPNNISKTSSIDKLSQIQIDRFSSNLPENCSYKTYNYCFSSQCWVSKTRGSISQSEQAKLSLLKAAAPTRVPQNFDLEK